jgi:Na+/H+ antiporter NhaD/arsenite permease-like protein
VCVAGNRTENLIHTTQALYLWVISWGSSAFINKPLLLIFIPYLKTLKGNKSERFLCTFEYTHDVSDHKIELRKRGAVIKLLV